jgi:uncharacterized lipoprotein YddW (UPF0748 family)
MRNSFRNLLLISLFTAMSLPIFATAYTTPKREARSTWCATVWNIDWPKTVISTTGNASQIAAQKNLLIRMLDSLAANNINSFNLQVRSRCDAMYKSSYEPWSTDLVKTRGMDPGWDPLAFAVEECHKRGIECNAWLNPYRYESNKGAWDGLPGCYRTDHPDWVMDYNGAAILNPGVPEVTQRIVDICKEIISNYDVDGILYDDYFYLSGTPMSVDAGLYDKYTAAGGTLSQADWRRNNVNSMIRSVYTMIQETKPYVRFGVGPAGVACTSTTVAAKYGIEPSPGSDWQYSDIYSDPIAWVSSKTLDYIAPQIYWTIGNSTDYAAIAPWWSTVANHFGRHFFSSHSITSLTSASTAPAINGASALEQSLMSSKLKASGPNNTSFSEYADEVNINRNSDLNGAPGSVWWSATYLFNTGSKESFGHYLKRTVYTKPSLMPAMPWKAGYNPGVVSNITLSNDTLKWNGFDNVRYTVYAVPNGVDQSTFNCDVQYLLGTSYATKFAIPAAYRSGYQFAVCVLDRVSNEYTPMFLGATAKTLAAPTLVYPINGAEAADPFNFKWTKVAGATSYVLQIASDAEFKNLTHSYISDTTSVSSALIEGIESGVPAYWRVIACAGNSNNGVSAGTAFTPRVLELTYPLANETNVAPTFTAKWTTANTGDEGTLEISTDAFFANGSTIFSGTSTTGEIDIPPFTLKAGTTYFARVSVTHDGTAKISAKHMFSIMEMTAEVPTIERPSEGDTVYSDYRIAVARQQAANNFTLEISNSATSWGRTRYVATLNDFAYMAPDPAGSIKVNSALMTNGSTYYVRARASYYQDGSLAYTDFCTPVSFIYSSKTGGISGISATDFTAKIYGGASPMLVVNSPASTITVEAASMLGVSEGQLYSGFGSHAEISLSDLQPGAHLLIVRCGGTVKTLKFIH